MKPLNVINQEAYPIKCDSKKLFMIRLPAYSSYKDEISLGQGCSGNHDI